ncbi:hypothetical protein GH733_006767 [Mirounga leonina]|nr:hypothetical protein GH733_006767 [Mirounga leonina]
MNSLTPFSTFTHTNSSVSKQRNAFTVTDEALGRDVGNEKIVFDFKRKMAVTECTVPVMKGQRKQECWPDQQGERLTGCGKIQECGFGYGEDAQCMTCRPHRFKEDWGFQKCKPCLECAAVNRFQKANCSVTSDAVCGDCLPGFYRKTKLVGFQDMECVPCGDPPPPYEPHYFLDDHNAPNLEGEFDSPGKNRKLPPKASLNSVCLKCTSKVNLVKIPSTASSPRDTALAAVICSALATVLLALFILCVIYCKRQFMEKKPSWPVHLIPSLCCDEACSVDRVTLGCRVHSKATLQESYETSYLKNITDDIPDIGGGQILGKRHTGPAGETVPTFFGSLSRSICGEFSDAWPLMQNPMCGDISLCDSCPELSGGDTHSLNPENESLSSLDSNSSQDLVGGAVPIHSENFTETTDPSRRNHSLTEPVLTQDTLTTRSQLHHESGDIISLTTQTSLQVQMLQKNFLERRFKIRKALEPFGPLEAIKLTVVLILFSRLFFVLIPPPRPGQELLRIDVPDTE